MNSPSVTGVIQKDECGGGSPAVSLPSAQEAV